MINKKFIRETFALIACLVLVGVPFLALAVGGSGDTEDAPPPIEIDSKEKLYQVLWNLLDVVVYIFWFLVVVFIIFAAYLYLTAGGDDAKVKKAHQMMTYTVVSIVIALVAYALPKLIRSIIAGGLS